MNNYKLYTTENPECIEWVHRLIDAAVLANELVEYGHCPVCTQVIGDGSEIDIPWQRLSDTLSGRGD